MEPKSRVDAVWNELERVVLSGTAEVVVKQHCPSCRAGLRISYTLVGSRAGLIMRCTKCHSATTLDGTFGPPAWVGTLGSSIVTKGLPSPDDDGTAA
jgi:hypothetical protein